MRRLLVAVLLCACGAAGCAAPQSPRQQELADRAFAAGEDERAETGYQAARAEAAGEDEALRAHLFELLARRARSGAEGLDAVLSELRTFSVSASHSPWGRLAGQYADEMAQVDALRWALQRSGAEIARLEQRVAELQASTLRAEQIGDELSELLGTLREERAALQRTLRETEELLVQRDAQIGELQAELDALKSIDMSRTP